MSSFDPSMLFIDRCVTVELLRAVLDSIGLVKIVSKLCFEITLIPLDAYDIVGSRIYDEVQIVFVRVMQQFPVKIFRANF